MVSSCSRLTPPAWAWVTVGGWAAEDAIATGWLEERLRCIHLLKAHD